MSDKNEMPSDGDLPVRQPSEVQTNLQLLAQLIGRLLAEKLCRELDQQGDG